MKKFVSTERKGFKMTFKNGLTISVQWGPENYCDNKTFVFDSLGFLDSIDLDHKNDAESNTAEVTIMIDNVIIKPSLILNMKKYFNADSYIIGFLSPEEVLNIMNIIKSYNIYKVNKIKSKIKMITIRGEKLTLYPPFV